MLKKTITYTDFNDVQRTEDFYFNLSKAEAGELELRHHSQGGIETLMRTAIETEDGNALMDFFRMLLSKSYGQKSEDGRFFRKSPEMAQDFLNSAAYDVLFVELLSEPNNAIAFFNGVFPKDLQEAVAKEQAGNGPRMPQDHQQKQAPVRNVFENVEAPQPEISQESEEQKQFRLWQAEQQRLRDQAANETGHAL